MSERELIARIEARLPPAPGWVVVGIGDDAAVVEPERNRLEVLTTDALVDGIHFDRRFTPPRAIGHRALAVNISDLAAMGAAPRLALLSFALPASLPCADFDEIVAGIAALAVVHRLHVVGGNLTRTPGPLTIDITITGTVKRRQILTRGGARPGDEIYVSGSVGGAAAGLQMLQSGMTMPSELIDRYFRPAPRARLGILLGRNRAASACIDLSDGLADGLHQIARTSGVGMTVDAAALPIDPQARGWSASRGDDDVDSAMTGGDDYELLFTVRARRRGRLRTVLRSSDVPVTRIGVCTDGQAVLLQRAHNGGAHEQPVPGGYDHFKKTHAR